MTIVAIKCKKCGDIIYSRATHDFRWCSCENIAIDGGFDYTKITGDIDNVENVILTMDDTVTRQVLYDDWNSGADKYGRISL